ncbi:golgin family A protein [Trema orientale]|uniref:Golgin family A protein n=1 Tax=Trema orientale TaxID=63057 RepID=A0A2P5EQB1_TREOI|nr:golgin family A protein [Trema orientale]
MNLGGLFHYQTSIPNSLSHSSSPQIPKLTFKCSSHSNPNLNPNPQPKTHIPARDRVIEFGKHKGKLLGTLPSSYLKWVSKTLRARDFEEWAKLADQVLQDPVYQDRIEWEFAQNVLDGNTNTASLSSSSSGNGKAVSELLEISERFGWDNEDKVGWSRVDFELLGTSKSGRIPRVGKSGGKREDSRVEKRGERKDGENEKRKERRERMRVKRGEERLGRIVEKEKGKGSLGNSGVDEKSHGKKEAVEVYNPFPGRESLLEKALQRKRFL